MCFLCDIQVISGYQIPKPSNRSKGEVIDPFVTVQVFGVGMDQQEVQTTVVKNNGENIPQH